MRVTRFKAREFSTGLIMLTYGSSLKVTLSFTCMYIK
jgi:hypothetical protein